MALPFFLKFPPAFGAFPHGCFLTVPFLNNDFDNIAKALANLSAYLSGNANDVTGRAHFYHLPPVRNAVKSSIYRKASFAKKFFDVIRDFHISGVHIPILKYHCAEFQFHVISPVTVPVRLPEAHSLNCTLVSEKGMAFAKCCRISVLTCGSMYHTVFYVEIIAYFLPEGNAWPHCLSGYVSRSHRMNHMPVSKLRTAITS